MRSIAKEDAFQSKCNSVFERMINTVPRTVTLSEPVVPLTWKAVDLQLDISPAGVVSIAGRIRNLHARTAFPPLRVPYTISSPGGSVSKHTSDFLSGFGTSIFGFTTYYSFKTTISSPSVTSLSFGDTSYPINDEIFVLPTQSTVLSAVRSFTIRAAALTSLNKGSAVKAVLYVPTSQHGTFAKKVVANTFSMNAYGTAGEYTLYTTGGVTVANAESVIVKVVKGNTASRTVKSEIFTGRF